jgi:hypothetical protein
MKRIESFLSEHLRNKLADRRVLTVFDPDRRFDGVANSLANDTCLVIQVGSDIITAREQAFEALADMGNDPSSSSQLVLYVSRSRPLEQEAVCLDPFTPLVLAGGVFPDGAGDGYLALCQRFLPEQSGVLEEMFRRAAPSFVEVNSLVTGSDGAPVLSGLLGAEGTRDLLVRFLCLSPKNTKALKQSPHWHTEFRSILSKTLGATLPETLVTVDELRHWLWRFVLFSEFAADVPGTLPAALSSVPRAAAQHRQFVLDLCGTLRDQTSTQQTYEEFANRVAGELALERHCQGIDDLGNFDTFAFEARTFLQSFSKAILADDLQRARQSAEQRSKSFWMRDGARAGEWKLATACLDLLQEVADLMQVLKSASPANVGGWMDFHVSHGYRLDAAHRAMEHVAQDWLPEPGPLAVSWPGPGSSTGSSPMASPDLSRTLSRRRAGLHPAVPGRMTSTNGMCGSHGRRVNAWPSSGWTRFAMTSRCSWLLRSRTVTRER